MTGNRLMPDVTTHHWLTARLCTCVREHVLMFVHLRVYPITEASTENEKQYQYCKRITDLISLCPLPHRVSERWRCPAAQRCTRSVKHPTIPQYLHDSDRKTTLKLKEKWAQQPLERVTVRPLSWRFKPRKCQFNATQFQKLPSRWTSPDSTDSKWLNNFF